MSVALDRDSTTLSILLFLGGWMHWLVGFEAGSLAQAGLNSLYNQELITLNF